MVINRKWEFEKDKFDFGGDFHYFEFFSLSLGMYSTFRPMRKISRCAELSTKCTAAATKILAQRLNKDINVEHTTC